MKVPTSSSAVCPARGQRWDYVETFSIITRGVLPILPWQEVAEAETHLAPPRDEAPAEDASPGSSAAQSPNAIQAPSTAAPSPAPRIHPVATPSRSPESIFGTMKGQEGQCLAWRGLSGVDKDATKRGGG